MDSFDLGANWNGTRTRMHLSDSEIILEDHSEKVGLQRLVDENTQMRNQARSLKGGYLARIPADLYAQWRQEWRTKHQDKWMWKTFLAQKLNSRDWLKLRTTEARI
jgi:hypothetical protein